MRFLHPDYAWALVAALAGAGVLRWASRRRFAAFTTLQPLGPALYRASVLRRLPLGLFAIAVLLLGGALMDPVLPYTEGQVTSRGLDIVVALDLSSSMLDEIGRVRPPHSFQNLTFSTRDAAASATIAKTKLEATKNAIKALVASRRDDRIGLVVFSDNAYVISPLTFDHDYVSRYIDMVDDQLLRGEGMTAIGDGLALANYLLAKQSTAAEHRNEVVILFTDGENNKGRDPVEVLDEANAANIRVHMVGIDLEEEVRNKPQVKRLLQTVRRFGGRYFSASTERDLEAASRTIDQIEKGELVDKTIQRNTPVYEWFALPALLCLVAASALRAIPFFIDQT
jgi:Ca-activated chloride channel homolog